jgi:hypothetical protein
MRAFTPYDLEISNYFARKNRIRLGARPYEGATNDAPCTLKTLEDIRNLQAFAFWITDGFVFENQFKNVWGLVSADCFSFLDPTPAFGEDGRRVVDLDSVFRVVVPGVDGRLHEQSFSVMANLFPFIGFNKGKLFGRRFPQDGAVGTLLKTGVGETISRLRNAFSENNFQDTRMLNLRQALLIGCPYVSSIDKPFLKTCAEVR